MVLVFHLETITDSRVGTFSQKKIDLTFREDANATIDKIAAQNLNIIRKWCFSILKITEVSKKKRSMKKKRYAISLCPTRLLEVILNS